MSPDDKDELPRLPERISGLWELAFNLWWSWHPEARYLFKMLNRMDWKLTRHNPVEMMHDCAPEIFEAAAEDELFLRQYDTVMARFRADMQAPAAWATPGEDRPGIYSVAFFSAEYGLHHSLPFYAGGLGFLAGDFLKESSDLAIPMVGVGFMYPEGYLRQRLTPDGWQISQEEPLEREHAPIVRVTDGSGRLLQVEVPFIDPPVRVGVWRARVGRVDLYLLDTDIEANDPWNRGISARLYAGNTEQRLRQEIVLGIGGCEVLNALGLRHLLLHLNEGHSAFAVFNRIREQVQGGLDFQRAFEQVRATTIFTTHTPVPAGHDVFPFSLMEKYFCTCWPGLGLTREAFFHLGVDPASPGAGFNMTALALRASARHNAVSERHAVEARRMWKPLWPEVAEDKVPIAAITNGVHLPTWIEPRIALLLERYLGPDWAARQDDPALWRKVAGIPDEELWRAHYRFKVKLLQRLRDKARVLYLEKTDPKMLLAAGLFLDPAVLTIGFARRFATYKRGTLVLRDHERLARLVTDDLRPLQIIFAGKAHPDDHPGQEVLRQVVAAAHDPAFAARIAFVEDYDELLAQYLVHGVDVWLNNPLPPMEACGTSGMKAMVNGVPQLSIVDGWWGEGFNGRNGWSFDRSTSGEDEADARSIYDILEKEVVPLYYRTDDDGVPRGWVAVMKEAMASVAPRFSTRRMVRQYAAEFYWPALGL